MRAWYATYISNDYKYIIAFILLVIILTVKPTGLFAKGRGSVRILTKRNGIIALIVFAFSFPISRKRLLSPYADCLSFIWAIAVYGINLLSGYTGYLSLAHAGFLRLEHILLACSQ